MELKFPEEPREIFGVAIRAYPQEPYRPIYKLNPTMSDCDLIAIRDRVVEAWNDGPEKRFTIVALPSHLTLGGYETGEAQDRAVLTYLGYVPFF